MDYSVLAACFGSKDRHSNVTAFLLDIGMPAKYDAFDYLVCIIPAYMDDHQKSASKELYPLAAKKCKGDSDDGQIERSIRRAIRATWETENRQIRQLFFPPDIYGTEAPSNMNFIARTGRLLELWEQISTLDDE